VYVGGVAASPVSGTVIRWLLLLCVLTAATIGLVGVAAETTGRPFVAVSVYWVSVVSVVLWAVPSAWLVRSRYASFSLRPERRLRRLHVPSETPRHHADGRERCLFDSDECPIDGILTRAAPACTSAAAIHLPEPHLDPRPATEDGVRPEGDSPRHTAPAHRSPPATSPGPSVPERSRTLPLPDRAPVVASIQSVGPAQELRPGGARELAEILNLYERVGLSHDANAGAPAGVPYRADSAAGERTLWGELVEDFGAASIDFRGADGGECWITLSTGDLVFYAPDHHCWMWVVFESVDDVPSPHAEAPPSVHIVADPS
jgi:hypothetical protein